MKLAVSSQRSAVSGFRKYILFCLLLTAYCTLSCSIPNLEKPECTAARDGVKQFYSFHFGNDMHSTPENLKLREKFLTPELFRTLTVANDTRDYFTASDDPPKTFKIGKCDAPQMDKAGVQVQIYWRDDAKTVQKEIHVEAVKTGDAWLINKVSN